MLSEDHDKARDSPVTFVTHERFAVLFFLLSSLRTPTFN